MSEQNTNNVQPKRIFQWIKGDNFGNVEYLKEIKEIKNKVWTIFESGKRVAQDLLTEYLMEVKEGEILDLKELKIASENTEHPKRVEIPVKPVNPLKILLEKQNTISEIDITITLPLKVQSKNLHDILIESFGEECESDMIEYIISGLNNEYIMEQIHKQIIAKLKESWT